MKPSRKKRNKPPVVRDGDWLYRKLTNVCLQYKMEAIYVMEVGFRLAGAACSRLGHENAFRQALDIFREEVSENASKAEVIPVADKKSGPTIHITGKEGE